MKKAFLAACGLLTACSPVAKKQPDPTAEESYTRNVAQLSAMSREASASIERGKNEEAGAIITKAQPLMERLLGVPRPTLEAMEAASDLDQLYGAMLLKNRHYGWARMQFQKNVARWKNWMPPTEETARRQKLASAAMAECDRHIGE